MKAARVLGFAAFACVLAVASVAIAAGTLSVTRKGDTVVNYPHPAQFTVKWTESSPETVTVQWRYVGGAWMTLRTISAARAAESTKPVGVMVQQPKADFEVRAVQGGIESAVATGGVRASVHAQARETFRTDKPILIKGSIMPTVPVGTAVTAKVWKKVIVRNGHGKKETVRVLVGEFPGSVREVRGKTSLWQVTFSLTTKGDYEARVFHDDATHAAGASKLLKFRVK